MQAWLILGLVTVAIGMQSLAAQNAADPNIQQESTYEQIKWLNPRNENDLLTMGEYCYASSGYQALKEAAPPRQDEIIVPPNSGQFSRIYSRLDQTGKCYFFISFLPNTHGGDSWYDIFTTVKADKETLIETINRMTPASVANYCAFCHGNLKTLNWNLYCFLGSKIHPILVQTPVQLSFLNTYIDANVPDLNSQQPFLIYGYGMAHAERKLLDSDLRPKNQNAAISLDVFFRKNYVKLHSNQRPFEALLIMLDSEYDRKREVELRAMFLKDKNLIERVANQLSNKSIEDYCKWRGVASVTFRRNLADIENGS